MSSLPASSATQTAATAAADPITNQVFTGPTSFSRVVRGRCPLVHAATAERSRDERPAAGGTKVGIGADGHPAMINPAYELLAYAPRDEGPGIG